MRITTNQIIANYQTGLNQAAVQMEKDRVTVMTGRSFQKASEDPSSAAKAFNLRKEYLATEDYIKNAEDIASRLESVYDSALQIKSITDQITGEMLQALNGTNSFESLQTYATSMDQMKESIVSSLNAKFGDTYMFGGENIAYAPFKLGEDGRLEYTKNGTDYVSVSGDAPTQAEIDGDDIRQTIVDGAMKPILDDDGNVIYDPVTGDPLMEPDEEAQAIYDTLHSYANDSIYVDLGFGLQYTSTTTTTSNDASLISNSAFDITTSGLAMMGFGDNEDGLPLNVVDLMSEFANELRKEEPNMDYLRDIYGQFTESTSDMMDFTTQISTNATYIDTTITRLEDAKAILNEKIVATEQVDLAEAITNYSWSTYAYNQALKIGTSILSQSFIDFM